MKKVILIFIFCFFNVAMFNAQAAGADLEIWPINQQISAQKSHSILWVKNSGTSNADIQIRIFKWSQANGKESLSPQQQVVALPPIVGILPGHQQPIRIINTAKASQQQAYRIVVDEIPTTPTKATKQSDYGLQLRMRYVLPLFINGATTPVLGAKTSATILSKLSWQLLNNKNQTSLSIKNSGTSYVRLSNVYFYNKKTHKKIELSSGLMGYVLAHSTMHWDFKKSIGTLDNNWQLMAQLSDNGKSVVIQR